MIVSVLRQFREAPPPGRRDAVACCSLPSMLVALFLTGCGGGERLATEDPVDHCVSRIVINEFAREATETGSADAQRLRVELHNAGTCVAEHEELTLTLGGQVVAAGAEPMQPGAYRVIDVVVPGTVAECDLCDRLVLTRARDGGVLDQVPVARTRENRQFAGRVPDGSGAMAIQEDTQLTLGAPNVDQGPVTRLTADGGFPARDSSPNASVQYRGAYWLFGGWGNHGHDQWYSVADVWRSFDGVNWRLVNPAPPYSPYSAFVVFRDRIWALGVESYSSVDGVEWRSEPLAFALTKRAVVFKDAIVGVVGDRVLRSDDGVAWITLTASAPWGPDRKEPQLLVHDGKLWLIGGTDEPAGGAVSYRSDVWNSEDGIHWVEVTASAEWGGRRWFNAITHAGKLWLLNGANYEAWADRCNNIADIWVSDDGAQWHAVPTALLWGDRHASFVMPALDGGFILAAGYGNCGIERMYADVWRVQYRPSMAATVPAVSRSYH